MISGKRRGGEVTRGEIERERKRDRKRERGEAEGEKESEEGGWGVLCCPK